MAKFKKEVLTKMKNDPELFTLLLKTLGLKPSSLPVTIERNGSTINQYYIVKLVAEYLDSKPEDLLEEETPIKERLS